MSALELIDRIALTRDVVARDQHRLAGLQALQFWQSQRLERTYADYAAEPRYRAAIEFFMQDLYGPHDFARRDRDLRKVLYQWERLLPERALQALVHALELEALSLALDIATADALGEAALTAEAYAIAYRHAGRRSDRQRQIWLTVAAGRALDSLIEQPAIGIGLRAARLPARVLGVATLQAFLERGYKAFKRMAGAGELLQAIEQRETTIMHRLFAGSSDPYRLDAPRRTSSAR
ncbi:MAG TPA: hypothetical protein VJT80_04445 [Steroidobacteraceae bacterium]|nr:hypothetical protein [Steroidobacteraceae bacterium]